MWSHSLSGRKKNLKGSAILVLKWENCNGLLVLKYVRNVSDTMILFPFGSWKNWKKNGSKCHQLLLSRPGSCVPNRSWKQNLSSSRDLEEMQMEVNFNLWTPLTSILLVYSLWRNALNCKGAFTQAGAKHGVHCTRRKYVWGRNFIWKSILSFEIAKSQLLIALSKQWALGGALVKILCHSAYIFLSPGCRRWWWRRGGTTSRCIWVAWSCRNSF